MGIVANKWITVLESDYDVKTGILLQNNDWIDISASGSVWSGVWFTGGNDPDGWRGWSAPGDSPLPGSPPFSLLGMTADDGYFFVGNSLRRTYLNQTEGPGETELFLRINDNRPGNGAGAFVVHITVWR